MLFDVAPFPFPHQTHIYPAGEPVVPVLDDTKAMIVCAELRLAGRETHCVLAATVEIPPPALAATHVGFVPLVHPNVADAAGAQDVVVPEPSSILQSPIRPDVTGLVNPALAVSVFVAVQYSVCPVVVLKKT